MALATAPESATQQLIGYLCEEYNKATGQDPVIVSGDRLAGDRVFSQWGYAADIVFAIQSPTKPEKSLIGIFRDATHVGIQVKNDTWLFVGGREEPLPDTAHQLAREHVRKALLRDFGA